VDAVKIRGYHRLEDYFFHSIALAGMFYYFDIRLKSIERIFVREAKNLPFIQYLVCLAVIKAITSEASSVLLRYGIASEFIENLKIKWPNDIYYKNTKIGGILCHSSYANGMYHVTNGIGLNLDNVVCINLITSTFDTIYPGTNGMYQLSAVFCN